MNFLKKYWPVLLIGSIAIALVYGALLVIQQILSQGENTAQNLGDDLDQAASSASSAAQAIAQAPANTVSAGASGIQGIAASLFSGVAQIVAPIFGGSSSTNSQNSFSGEDGDDNQ